jgi:hypothetical protein
MKIKNYNQIWNLQKSKIKNNKNNSQNCKGIWLMKNKNKNYLNLTWSKPFKNFKITRPL